MKKAFLTTIALTLMSFGLAAGSQAPQTPPRVAAPASSAAAKPATAPQTPAAYQDMMNRYCVTCHNEKAQIPAGAPAGAG